MILIALILCIGNFRNKVLEGNMIASVRVNSRTDNVAGVKLPVFVQYDTGAEAHDNLGLAGGGRRIDQCRENFGEYLKALIKVASLQTSFLAMDEALKVTNRRVNALENVTIPKIDTTISYINRFAPPLPLPYTPHIHTTNSTIHYLIYTIYIYILNMYV